MKPTVKRVQKITPINTIEYVVSSRIPESRRIVVKYGLPPATSPDDLWLKINHLVKQFPNEVMKDIADIHPDKQLISNFLTAASSAPIAPPTPTPTKPIEKKLSACGCSGADGVSECCGGADGEKSSGCDGKKGCGCGCKDKSSFNTMSNFNTVPKMSNAEGDEPKSVFSKSNAAPILLTAAVVTGILFMIYGKKIIPTV